DQLSLNGSPVPLGDAPDSALARYEIAPGGREVWRVLNAATDAFLDLALVDQEGKPLPLQVLARDGSPLRDDAGTRLRPPPTLAPLPVPPAGRIELLVRAPPPGVRAWLVTHAVDTGCAGDRLPERRLAMLTAAPAASASSTSSAKVAALQAAPAKA